MATAYKYVKREAEDNINWAKVGQDFTTMLDEEVQSRRDKKQAIDDATREYQKVLNNVPQGENSNLNGMALGFSADLQKQMLMQETLLKSGQLPPEQYTMMRQNLTDGTDQGFSLLQDYNTEYSSKMALLSNDLPVGEQLSAVDLEIMANAEGFANFNDSRLVINPENGQVMMANMIADPNNPDGPKIPNPDPNSLVSPANLKNRIKTKILKYDVVGNAEAWTDSLGKDVVQTVTSMGSKYTAGTIKKISDITARKGGIKDMDATELAALATELGVDATDIKAYSLYQEAQNNWADGQISDDSFSGASVLMDFVDFTPDGKEYSTTFNPKEVFEADSTTDSGYKEDKDGNPIRQAGKENIILLETKNGRTVSNLSETQNNVAKRALKSQTGIQVDYEELETTEFMKKDIKPSELEDKNAKLNSKQDNVYSNVAKLYYGSDAEVDEAIKFLRSTNPDITDIDRNGEDVIVRYANGKTETIPFNGAGGEQLGQKSWVDGSANFFLGSDDKIADINKVSDRSKVDLTRDLNKISLGYGGEEVEVKDDLEAAYIAEISQGQPAPSVTLVADDEDESRENLANVVSSLPGLTGFTVDTAAGGSDELVINNGEDKEVARINLDKSTYGTTAKYNEAIAKFMESVYAMSSNATSAEDKALKVGKRGTSKSRRGSLRPTVDNNVTTGSGAGTGGGVNGGAYNQ